MTFLENLAPLLEAAEKYAELTRQRNAAGQRNAADYPIDMTIAELIMDQNEAGRGLLAAAIEFAKWGK